MEKILSKNEIKPKNGLLDEIFFHKIVDSLQIIFG